MTSSKGGVGGVTQMMIFDDIGGVGVPKVPKMDDVIYEQSLSEFPTATKDIMAYTLSFPVWPVIVWPL